MPTPRILERGSGWPLILIPGIQGRCEWGLPTFDALGAVGRAVTYSLADEPSSHFPWSEEDGFDNYLRQLADVIDRTTAVPPVLVGISFGGLIAAEFVARHPDRVAGLVLASAPPPTWTLPKRAQRYLLAPRLMAPVFWLGAPLRAYPEVRAAIPQPRARVGFLVDQGLRIAAAPPSSGRMARRLRWLRQATSALIAPLDVPALIVTGEPSLERVVPPESTLEYLRWLPSARVVTMAGTGHGGTVTRPLEFASHIREWLHQLPPVRSAAGPPVGASEEFVRAHRVP